MLCAAFDKKQKLKLVEYPVPEIKENEALVKVEACGVCGSDLVKIKNNLIPEGTVLGHEVVGTIVETGCHVKKWFPAQKVIVAHHVPCLTCYYCKSGNFSMCSQFKNTNLFPGGFSEYVKLSRAHLDHTTFLIPKGTVPDYEIALTEPLACCLRAVNRAQISTSNSVLISGLGSIGMMLGKLCLEKGAYTLGIDPLEERIKLAEETSFIHEGHLAISTDLNSWILNKTEGRGVDVVFLASGNEQSILFTGSLIRSGGKIIVFSSVPKEGYFYNNEIYFRELTIMGCYSPSPTTLKEAYQMIITGKIKLGSIITDVVSLKQLPNQIEKCFKNKSLKMIVKFE